MPALSDVLAEAASRDAFEVIMETGRPVLMNTRKGGVPVGDALAEDDLFAVLTAVLDQEQQVELMVGNVIEFNVTAKGDWHVVAEPGRDGITIRARVAGAVQAVRPSSSGRAIDLPPVAPFAGGGAELPPMAEDSFSNLSMSRPTPDDVEAVDFASEFSSMDTGSIDGFDMPAAGGGAFGDPLGDPLAGLDDDDEVELDIEQELDPPPARAPAIDPDEDTADFALLEPPAAAAPAPRPPSRAEMAKTRDIGPAIADVATEKARHESATRLNLVPPPASPIADTRSDLGTVSDRVAPVSGDFEAVAKQVPLAGLTLVHLADADDVVAALGCDSVLVDDGSDPADVASTLHELPPGGSVAVLRVEDPSAWLAWCLRRLEEGYGVLVQTRALSPGGGKRCLLGPGATVRVESWLGRHVTRSLVEIDGLWTLVLPQ